MTTELEINGEKVRTIIDTGAGGSIISEDLRERLGLPIVKDKSYFKGLGGKKFKSKGYAITTLKYGEHLEIGTRLAIVPGEKNVVLLGNDILSMFEIEITGNELTLKKDGKFVTVPISTVKIEYDQEIEDSDSSDESSEEEIEEQNDEMEISLLDKKKVYMEILLTNVETLEENLKKEIWKNEERNNEFKEWKGWLIKRLDEVCNELERRHQEYGLEREKLEKKTISKVVGLLEKWKERINEELILEMKERQNFCIGLIKRILNWIEEQKKKDKTK